MKSRITVSSPGSIANLGPGFDVFALALKEPRDIVEISFAEEMRVSNVSGFKSIPKNPTLNSVTLAAKRVFEMAGSSRKFEVSIDKNVDIGKGLGSSGASAAAGAVAANKLLGKPLGKSKLIEAAGFAEEKTAGSAHYDNVAASILGDFVIVGPSRPPEFDRIGLPDMKLVIAVPENKASTKEGRKELPKKVRLSDSVTNVARASLMVSAVKSGDIESFAENMIDQIVEPLRSSRLPGVKEAKKAASDAGALGAALSGAGPSVFAVSKGDNLDKIKKAMRKAFEGKNQECKTFVTEPGSGCRIQEEDQT